MIEVLNREDWGADPNLPKLGWQVPVEQFVGLVIHHTVMALNDVDADGYAYGDLDDIAAYMRRLQTARPDLGLDVPYSFVVFEGLTDDDAVIGIGRGQFRTGAHTAGYNSTAWGIALAGDYSERPPSPGQLEAIRLIGRWLADPTNAMPTLGHRDTVATACPGASAYPLLDQVQPPFTTTTPPPPIEDDDMVLLVPDTGIADGVFAYNGTHLRWVNDGNEYAMLVDDIKAKVVTVNETKLRAALANTAKVGGAPTSGKYAGSW